MARLSLESVLGLLPLVLSKSDPEKDKAFSQAFYDATVEAAAHPGLLGASQLV